MKKLKRLVWSLLSCLLVVGMLVPAAYAAPNTDPNINRVTDIDGNDISNYESFSTAAATATAPDRTGYTVIKTFDFSFGGAEVDPNGYYVYLNVAGIKKGDTVQTCQHISDQWVQIEGVATDNDTVRMLLKVDGTIAVYRVAGTSGGTTTGSLSLDIPVTKKLVGVTPPTDETFRFTIAPYTEKNETAPLPDSGSRLTIKGAGTESFEKLDYANSDAGSYYYVITETDRGVPGYTYDDNKLIVRVDVVKADANATPPTSSSVAIGAVTVGSLSGTALNRVEFTNRYTTSSLIVSKKVTGDTGDKTKAFTFTATLDDTQIDGTYGDMKFTDGVAVFTLKHGESKTAADLPIGLEYTVTESDNKGYSVTKTGDHGTLTKKTSVAEFVNHRSAPADSTTSVSVNKVWSDGNSSSRPDSVQVQLYKDGKASGNTVQLNAKNNWKHTWTQLDKDAKWTVDEINVPSGYSKAVTASGLDFTITNTKKTTTTNTTSNTTGKTSPNTGDESNIGQWLVLATLSLLGVCGTGFFLLKKRTR